MEAASMPEEVSATERQAVYRCFGVDGALLYIGTTGKFGRRIADHAQKIWFLEVRQITLDWYADEEAALEAERSAIRAEQPKYNVLHKNARIASLPPRRSQRPARPSPKEPPAPLHERREAFAAALDEAQKGVTVHQLVAVSGIGRTYAHQLLGDLVSAGAVTRVSRGLYRTKPGRSAVAVIGPTQAPLRTPRTIP